MNRIIKTVAVVMAGMVLMANTAEAAPHYGRVHRPHCPPPRHHVVHHVHQGGCEAGWVVLGAMTIGALIDGLVGR